MKFTKLTIAILLSVTLILLAGCGGEKKQEQKPAEKPKDELLHEKNKDEKDLIKDTWKNPMMGPGRLEPMRPFMPRPVEKKPWGEMPNPHDWEKGPVPKK